MTDPPGKPSVVILMPAYNEAAHITSVIDEVRSMMADAPIILVDDGSTDDTARLALEAGAIVLPLPINLGYGAALQTGYKYARTLGAEYLIQLDSDGQHDARALSAVLAPVQDGRCDICIGSRFLSGETYRIPITRRAGMAVFRRVASWLLGQTVTDPTSGFQAMNAAVIQFFCSDSYPTDYPDTDVLVMLHHNGFRILESPVIMHASRTGRSIHRGLRPMYYVFKMSLAIPLNLLRKER